MPPSLDLSDPDLAVFLTILAVDLAPQHLGRHPFQLSTRPSFSPSLSSNFRIPHNATDTISPVSPRSSLGSSRPKAKFKLKVGKESKSKSKSKFKSKGRPEIIRIDTAPEAGGSPGIHASSKPPEELLPLPPLDRSVDLVAIADDTAGTALFLEEPYLCDGVNPKFPLHRLPRSVQQRIYKLCFPKEHRKISLSPWFATKAVYDHDYFASPWDVLDDVAGGLSAFTAIRKDLLSYFWTNYHFHVTLNGFSGPMISPLSHVWLQSYLGSIQFFTVELDFTKLSGDCVNGTADFAYSTSKIEPLLMDVIAGLLRREESTTMAELNLLCRRYERNHHPYQDLKNLGMSPRNISPLIYIDM